VDRERFIAQTLFISWNVSQVPKEWHQLVAQILAVDFNIYVFVHTFGRQGMRSKLYPIVFNFYEPWFAVKIHNSTSRLALLIRAVFFTPANCDPLCPSSLARLPQICVRGSWAWPNCINYRVNYSLIFFFDFFDFYGNCLLSVLENHPHSDKFNFPNFPSEQSEKTDEDKMKKSRSDWRWDWNSPNGQSLVVCLEIWNVLWKTFNLWSLK